MQNRQKDILVVCSFLYFKLAGLAVIGPYNPRTHPVVLIRLLCFIRGKCDSHLKKTETCTDFSCGIHDTRDCIPFMPAAFALII